MYLSSGGVSGEAAIPSSHRSYDSLSSSIELPSLRPHKEGERLGDSEIVHHLGLGFNRDIPDSIEGAIGPPGMRTDPQITSVDPAAFQGIERVLIGGLDARTAESQPEYGGSRWAIVAVTVNSPVVRVASS